MQPTQIILLIAVYFGVLILISYLTGKEDSNEAFFKANKSAPWYLVAFGMIGASLSGVTFISVPGLVEGQQFAYLQGVLGFFVGYLIVLLVLIPLYYQLNVTSIYQYLEDRFGKTSYKTGAFFFLISRVTGASFRLYLVALAMQYIVFESLGIPFWVTVVLSILLIWLYTNKGGIKTIIWTDTIQTLAMLISVSVAIILILNKLDWSLAETFTKETFKNKKKCWIKNKFNKYENHQIVDIEELVGEKGAVIAVEPTPFNLRFLYKNISPNTKVMQLAASEIEGKMDFYTEKFGGFTNSLISEFTEENNKFHIASQKQKSSDIQKIEVDVSTIDLICKNNLFTPSFIKIDVEGAELNVLKGAVNTLKTTRALMVEINRNVEEIYDLLLHYNFIAFDSKGNEIFDNKQRGNIFFIAKVI